MGAALAEVLGTIVVKRGEFGDGQPFGRTMGQGQAEWDLRGNRMFRKATYYHATGIVVAAFRFDEGLDWAPEILKMTPERDVLVIHASTISSPVDVVVGDKKDGVMIDLTQELRGHLVWGWMGLVTQGGLISRGDKVMVR